MLITVVFEALSGDATAKVIENRKEIRRCVGKAEPVGMPVQGGADMAAEIVDEEGFAGTDVAFDGERS